jgi:hypothetical protein
MSKRLPFLLALLIAALASACAPLRSQESAPGEHTRQLPPPSYGDD